MHLKQSFKSITPYGGNALPISFALGAIDYPVGVPRIRTEPFKGYAIRYTLYAIRYTLYAIRYTLYAIRYTLYAIRY